MFRVYTLFLLTFLLTAPAWGQNRRPSRQKRPVNPYRRTYQKGDFKLAPTDSTSPRVPFVHFPYPIGKGISRATMGATFTTTPRDITEEVQLSVPAGDVVVLHGLTDNLALTGRFTFQFLQNRAETGLRYSFPLKGRFYGSVGVSASAWFGSLQLSQFNNRGLGIQGMPTVAIGFRSSRNLLVTLRGQADLTFFYRSSAGNTIVEGSNKFYNGAGGTITLEQAFFGRRHVALGFRALYTDFNWQFWSLYSTFDRAIFFPEAFIGFFL